MSQDLPPEVDHVGEGFDENIDPIDRIVEGAPPPPPSRAGMHLQRDFDTNAAMVNDILAVSDTEAPEQAQTVPAVDADDEDGGRPDSITLAGNAPLSPDLFPTARAKKRTRRSK